MIKLNWVNLNCYVTAYLIDFWGQSNEKKGLCLGLFIIQVYQIHAGITVSIKLKTEMSRNIKCELSDIAWREWILNGKKYVQQRKTL